MLTGLRLPWLAAQKSMEGLIWAPHELEMHGLNSELMDEGLPTKLHLLDSRGCLD